MSQQTRKTQSNGSTFIRLLDHLKLSWRIFRDPSVSPFVRYGIPILGLIYLILPTDVVPDVLLGLGQLDDAAVLLLLSQLMTMLAPKDVVNKYRQAAEAAAGAASSVNEDVEEVIDADYREIP